MADSPQPGGVKRSFDESTSGSEWTSRKGGHHHRPPSSESPVGGSGGTGGGGGVGGTGGGAGRGGAGGAGRYVLPSILDGTGGRVPTISRKVRACAACKKQKIRCDFEEGETTCVRCKKMKLECVVNRSLQTILDEDVEYVILPEELVEFWVGFFWGGIAKRERKKKKPTPRAMESAMAWEEGMMGEKEIWRKNKKKKKGC